MKTVTIKIYTFDELSEKAQEKAILSLFDINVDYNWASRHTNSAINGALNGTVLTEDATPIALPDLSSTTWSIGNIYNGTIALFQQDDNDWTDTGVTYESST